MAWKRLYLIASLTFTATLAACNKSAPQNHVAVKVSPFATSSASPVETTISPNTISPNNEIPTEPVIHNPKGTTTRTDTSKLPETTTTPKSVTTKPTGTKTPVSNGNKAKITTQTGTTKLIETTPNPGTTKPKAPTCSNLGFSRDESMETKDYQVNICGSMEEGPPLTFLSFEKATGKLVKLPVAAMNHGVYAARDGDVTYAVAENFFRVTQEGKTLVDQDVISFKINGKKIQVDKPVTSPQQAIKTSVDQPNPSSGNDDKMSADSQPNPSSGNDNKTPADSRPNPTSGNDNKTPTEEKK